MLDRRTVANGMNTFYIIFILSNTHFLSWSFILIKDQIAQNIPTKSLIPVNLLMDLYILSKAIKKISQWYFFTPMIILFRQGLLN